VIPLHWITNDGDCSCPPTSASRDDDGHCRTPGKHPQQTKWQHRASNNPGVITRRWATSPHANVGGVAGARSGFVVLDLDPRNMTDESRAWLEAHPLPRTRTHATGGGGTHHVFLHPGEGLPLPYVTALAPGVELLGDGHVVILPGSRTARPYVVADDAEPVALPTWLLASSGRGSDRTRAREKRPDHDDERGHRTGADPITHARNVALTKIAGRLRRDGLDTDELAHALLGINAARCNPPLPEREVERIAQHIGARQPGGLSPTTLRELRILEDAIRRTPWRGLAGATDRAVLQTHVNIRRASRRGSYHASVREIAERAGVNRSTASNSHARLRAAGWLVSLGRHEDTGATEWRLAVPAASENRTLRSYATGGDQSVRFSLAPSDDAFRWRALGKNAAPVLRALAAGARSPRAVAEMLGLHVTTARRLLALCAEHGHAVRDDGGGWRVAEVGRVAFARTARARRTAGKGAQQRAQHAAERGMHRLAVDLLAQGRARTLAEATRLARGEVRRLDRAARAEGGVAVSASEVQAVLARFVRDAGKSRPGRAETPPATKEATMRGPVRLVPLAGSGDAREAPVPMTENLEFVNEALTAWCVARGVDAEAEALGFRAWALDNPDRRHTLAAWRCKFQETVLGRLKRGHAHLLAAPATPDDDGQGDELPSEARPYYATARSYNSNACRTCGTLAWIRDKERDRWLCTTCEPERAAEVERTAAGRLPH